MMDKATKELVNTGKMLPLMEAFYDQLSDAKAPSDALVNSSRNFLKTAPPELVHPHYWAAFTLVGVDNPVTKISGRHLPVLVISMLLAVLILIKLTMDWKRNA